MSDQPTYKSKAARPPPKRPNFIPTTPNYYSYSWVDKDPDMDFIVGLIGEAQVSPEDIERETEKLGHRVSRYTVMGWLYGSVRRPQNYTMTIVAMALGYTKTWAPASEKEKTSRAKAGEGARAYAHH